MSVRAIQPVRVATVVNVPPERAWEAFTAELSSWWPGETHSILSQQGGRPDRIVVEPRAGGEIYGRPATSATTGGRSWPGSPRTG